MNPELTVLINTEINIYGQEIVRNPASFLGMHQKFRPEIPELLVCHEKWCCSHGAPIWVFGYLPTKHLETNASMIFAHMHALF